MQDILNNPPMADALGVVPALEVPEECNVKATIRARSPPRRMTSMVVLDYGIPQELEVAVSFFGYFFADQKSNWQSKRSVRERIYSNA